MVLQIKPKQSILDQIGGFLGGVNQVASNIFTPPAVQAALAKQKQDYQAQIANLSQQGKLTAPQASAAKQDISNKFTAPTFTKVIKDYAISPVQQGFGQLADTAIQGGGVLSSLGNASPAEKAKDIALTNAMRAKLHSFTDVSGNPIGGTSEADTAGTNIATGHGTLNDVGQVAKTAGEVGLSATLLDPANLAKSAERALGVLKNDRPIVTTKPNALSAPLPKDTATTFKVTSRDKQVAKEIDVSRSATDKDLANTLGGGTLYNKDVVVTSTEVGKPTRIHGTVISSTGGRVTRTEGTMFSRENNPTGEHYTASGITKIRDGNGNVHELANAEITSVKSAEKPLSDTERMLKELKNSKNSSKQSTVIAETAATPEGVARARQQSDANAAYQAQQNQKATLYKQNPVINALKVTQRELADPRAIQQRLDNQEFSRLKKAGLTRKGQKELLPEQSLAFQRGQIENPGQAAAVKASTPYTVNGKTYTLNQINKFYGHSEGAPARAFENYRIFKDELESITSGKAPTLGLDTAQMMKYVADYEKANPLAIEHNAVLRQVSLDNFKARTKAGIDNPDIFNATAGRQFYNPRKAVNPDELLHPKIEGGVRSGTRGTQLRSETAGGPVRSPIQTFYDDTIQTEKALAQQRYNTIIKERTRAGNLKGATEVVNAETTIRHKALLKDVEDLRAIIKGAKKERNGIAKDAQVAKKGSAKAKRSTTSSEVRIVAKMREILKKAEGDSTSVYNDLVQRDPKHAQEVTAVHTKYDTAIDTAKANKDIATVNRLNTERKNALDAVDKKYPKPKNLTDRDLLDLAYSLRNPLTGKATVSKKLSGDLANESTRLKAALQDSRDYVNGLEANKSETFGDYAATTQHQERGLQTVEYKVDGEVGKIEIPADLAAELDAANRAANQSLVEKGLQTAAAAQKITWTGVLAPVWKLINTFLKNPTLAFFNGDGLSGVGLNSIGAFFRSIVRTKGMQAFKSSILKGGASYENALQTRNIRSTVANDIAARSNIVSFFARNPVHTLQDLWKGLNVGLTHFDNAQRTAVAYGAKQRALRLGFSEEEATQIAAQATAKVFGDFDRVSRLARNMEIAIPYSGATQAGGLAMGRAWKTKPVQTAFKAATVIAAAGGITAWGISNNHEYYDDMVKQHKEYLLDSNLTVVLPGAYKDDKGHWHGVIQVPLVPDLRPLNRATWRSVYSVTGGHGIDPGMIAEELFNQFTQDVPNNIYDASKSNNGKDPLNALFNGSPALNSIKINAGINPSTGQPLASDYVASLPRDQQVNPNTSDTAKTISKSIGGVLTPIQTDAYLSRMGSFGKGVQQQDSTDGTPTGFVDNFLNFKKPFQPGTSQTVSKEQGQKYYDNLTTALTPLNENERNAFTSLHPNSKDNTGAQDYVSDSTYNPAARLDIYNRFPKVFQADKQLNDKAAADGSPNNPLYGLTPEQVKVVLEHDNLPPGAKDPQLSNLYSKEWYTQYALDKTKFFNDVKASQQTGLAQAQKEGDLKKVESLQQSIDKFNSPDNPYPTTDPNLQKAMDSYNALPKGTGARSGWIRSNPQAWAAMQNQFAAIDNWQNIQRGKRGLDATEGAAGIANGYGTSTSSSGSSPKPVNPANYTVSLTAGGSAPKAGKYKVKLGALRKGKAVAKSSAKPKVSIKKSLV